MLLLIVTFLRMVLLACDWRGADDVTPVNIEAVIAFKLYGDLSTTLSYKFVILLGMLRLVILTPKLIPDRLSEYSPMQGSCVEMSCDGFEGKPDLRLLLKNRQHWPRLQNSQERPSTMHSLDDFFYLFARNLPESACCLQHLLPTCK